MFGVPSELFLVAFRIVFDPFALAFHVEIGNRAQGPQVPRT